MVSQIVKVIEVPQLPRRLYLATDNDQHDYVTTHSLDTIAR